MRRSCGEECKGPKVSSVAEEQKARGCGRRYVPGKVIRGQAVVYETRKELLRSHSKGLR